MTFAANAQLKYNGNLMFGINENYNTKYNGPFLSYDSGYSVSSAWAHIFISRMDQGEFFIDAGVPGHSNIGPVDPGVLAIYDPRTAYYHDVHLKNLFNYSDERAKTNIRPLNSATSTIMRLNPVTYQFVKQPSSLQYSRTMPGADGTETGFIAQELARVLPNAVAIHEDKIHGDQYLVNYIAIIPVLVESVQELNARIEALEQEITILKNR